MALAQLSAVQKSTHLCDNEWKAKNNSLIIIFQE